MLSRHTPKPSDFNAKDPEAPGAYVRIIEMAASAKGVEPGLLEKGERSVGRLRHHSFPWRVLLPVTVSPRLRGLILLNLVRTRTCRPIAATAAAAQLPAVLPCFLHASSWLSALWPASLLCLSRPVACRAR